MIRVNLLPQKRRKAAPKNELWLVVSLAAVALEIVGFLMLFGAKQDELEW